jgi:hypothetical protein
MFYLTRTARRITRRLLRPAVAFVLVMAQVVTAFGYPVVVRGTSHVKACGCPIAGPNESCCCEANTCCAPAVASVPEPEPEPETCPKCRAKQAAKQVVEKPAPTVRWVVALKARQCHGAGPLGLFADIPAVPPFVPADGVTPVPTGVVDRFNHFFVSTSSIPLEPPPRRG